MAAMKDKILSPVRPSAGLAVDYRKKMDALIDAMTRSYARWIIAQYRKTPPELAQDASKYQQKIINRTEPVVRELQRELTRLGRQWERKFIDMAPRMAGWFAKATDRRTSNAMQHILRKGGMAVEFKMTPTMRQIVDATVAENVALIKSIAQQYHTQVEGLVMRSVSAGRDLGQLSKELEARFGVTKRRAALIAKDQNDKVTAAFTRVRQEEAGIEEAIWLHSHGGKEQRPTHLGNDGKRYKVKTGWWDPAERKYIWPGMLINCLCTSRPIVRGFS